MSLHNLIVPSRTRHFHNPPSNKAVLYFPSITQTTRVQQNTYPVCTECTVRGLLHVQWYKLHCTYCLSHEGRRFYTLRVEGNSLLCTTRCFNFYCLGCCIMHNNEAWHTIMQYSRAGQSTHELLHLYNSLDIENHFGGVYILWSSTCSIIYTARFFK